MNSTGNKMIKIKSNSSGCGGCLTFILLAVFLYTVAFGMRIDDKYLEIDLFPPGVYYSTPMFPDKD